jgi:hypothetical protein
VTLVMLDVLDVGIGSLTAPRAVFRFGVPVGSGRRGRRNGATRRRGSPTGFGPALYDVSERLDTVCHR